MREIATFAFIGAFVVIVAPELMFAMLKHNPAPDCPARLSIIAGCGGFHR